MNKSKILVAPGKIVLTSAETLMHLAIAKHHSLMMKAPLEVRTPSNTRDHFTKVAETHKSNQKIIFYNAESRLAGFINPAENLDKWKEKNEKEENHHSSRLMSCLGIDETYLQKVMPHRQVIQKNIEKILGSTKHQGKAHKAVTIVVDMISEIIPLPKPTINGHTVVQRPKHTGAFAPNPGI